MSEDTSISTQQSFSFGKRLASARGALNLSREEVAKELKLNLDIIVALEDEDYEKLAVPIFVTGYLRNYARLLKIPVEPLLAAYGQIEVGKPVLVADAARKTQPTFNGLLVKIASVSIVLVLITGIVSWLKMQDFEPSAIYSLVKEKTQTPEPESIASLAPLPELLDPVEEEKPAVPDVVEAAPILENPPATTVSEPVIEAPEPAVEASKPTEANNALISLSEDSWVEVSDNNGKRLIYDLLRANKDYQVSGSTPFKVFLGNAKAVRIEYNGELVNLDKYTRGNLARFRLGAAGE